VPNNEAGLHDTDISNNINKTNSKVAGIEETRFDANRACVIYQSVAGIAAKSLDASLVCVRLLQPPVITAISQVILLQNV